LEVLFPLRELLGVKRNDKGNEHYRSCSSLVSVYSQAHGWSF
jgi:hypothetical protein